MRKKFQNAGKLAMMMAVFTIAISGFAARAHAAPFDQAFIDAMTPHHQSALVMANMAVKQAQLPEVKKLARSIIAAQKEEIAQMKAWRKAWFDSAQTPMMKQSSGKMTMPNGKKMVMSNGKMAMPGKMMGLPMKGEMDMGELAKAKGREFDKMFLMMMIPHHASAISMAQEALDVTGRKELRNLAHNIIASQAREIGQMQGILDRRF